MDNGFRVDVSAEIIDPRWQVRHEAYDKCVLMQFGTPGAELVDGNLLQLWFREPTTVVDLGKSLMTAGMRLTAQLRGTLPAPETSGEGSGESSVSSPPTDESVPPSGSGVDGGSDKE